MDQEAATGVSRSRLVWTDGVGRMAWICRGRDCRIRDLRHGCRWGPLLLVLAPIGAALGFALGVVFGLKVFRWAISR